MKMQNRNHQRNQEDFRIAYEGIVKPIEAKFGVYTAYVYYKSSEETREYLTTK
jgi:hypothetical protein